ncbi:MAG: tetratricopeptide repeat protein, partial [Candidatus Sericytochromatia bacterium]
LARALALPGAAHWGADPAGASAVTLLPPLPVPTREAAPADPAVAEAVLDYARGRPDTAVSTLLRAVLASPADPLSRKLLGSLWLEFGEYEAAAAQFEAALRTRPGDAQALYQLAWAYGGLYKFKEAIATARRAVAVMPHWPEARLRLGALLIRDGQLVEGHRAVLEALGPRGLSAEVHYEAGNMLLEQGAHDRAIPYLEQALRWRPDSSYAANNLGNAYKAVGRMEDARRAYERAIAVDPANPNPRNALGVLSEEAGDQKAALDHYRAATRVDPAYPDAHYNAGVLLLKQRRHAEAASELLLASRLNPDLAMAHFQLAEALYGLGQLHRAIESHRKATAIDPDLSRIGGAVHRLLKEPAHDRPTGR